VRKLKRSLENRFCGGVGPVSTIDRRECKYRIAPLDLHDLHQSDRDERAENRIRT